MENYESLATQLVKDLRAKGQWTRILLSYARRRDQQIAIARRRLEGETFDQIAQSYGVCKQNIRHLYNKEVQNDAK